MIDVLIYVYAMIPVFIIILAIVLKKVYFRNDSDNFVGELFIDETNSIGNPDIYLQLWIEADELKSKKNVSLLVDKINISREK